MRNFTNSNGTTSSSFSIGSRGIRLDSREIINSSAQDINAILGRYCLSSNGHAFMQTFNTEIPINRVISINQDKITDIVTIKFVTDDLQEITITLHSTRSPVGTIVPEGQSGVTPRAVVVFEDGTGNRITDSGSKIVYTVENDNNLPTGSAVIGYMGELLTPLRLISDGIHEFFDTDGNLYVLVKDPLTGEIAYRKQEETQEENLEE